MYFYRNEEKSQLAQRDFATHMKEATYWWRIELVASMLSFYVALCYFAIA